MGPPSPGSKKAVTGVTAVPSEKRKGDPREKMEGLENPRSARLGRACNADDCYDALATLSCSRTTRMPPPRLRDAARSCSTRRQDGEGSEMERCMHMGKCGGARRCVSLGSIAIVMDSGRPFRRVIATPDPRTSNRTKPAPATNGARPRVHPQTSPGICAPSKPSRCLNVRRLGPPTVRVREGAPV